MAETKKKNNFIAQGGILALAGIISRIIGMLYRIPLMNIIGEIRQVLEMTPPELCEDIMRGGIILTGGSAQLPGLDALIVDELGIPVSVGRVAEESTILGAGAMADHFEEIVGQNQTGKPNG